jgi:hypothetical protein
VNRLKTLTDNRITDDNHDPNVDILTSIMVSEHTI